MVAPQHIIAIGASAGGMDEINSFFDNTPLDGVAYVIIQHLSVEFKSRMVELLTKHSKLKVKEAENEMAVLSNEVYLIPNDKFMTIINNKLHLTDKEKSPRPHHTIDIFFNSLAIDCGKKAIGVILSGLGSDGTNGTKAIKRNGGMIIAQNPATTAFKSMPSGAIGTGLVDFILEAASMPQAIEDYIKYGEDMVITNKDDEKNLQAIIDLIKDKSPLDFSDYKQTTILRRTKRRAAFNNYTTLGNYLNFLKGSPQEIEALSRDYLISVTAFFRDKEAFEFIQKNVIPNLLNNLEPGEELKMWVAGCATGEEVYSIAILVYEQLTGKFEDVVVKIFATDIDGAALSHAGKGIYNSKVVKNLSPERLEKYFLKEGNNYRIKPAIRKLTIFSKHDLVRNPPYCNMHFISCRNLLIYMTPILQKKIFSLLLFGLKKNGYLFLGPSENPMSIIRNLEVINKKWNIYKNLEAKRVVRFDAFSIPNLLESKLSHNDFLPENVAKGSANPLSEMVNANLADQLHCLIVCIDENNRVIKHYGDTANYLLQQNFNTNLGELLPAPLAIAFKALSATALKTNKQASAKGIKVRGANEMHTRLTVTPLNLKHKMLMVTFNEDKPVVNDEDRKIAFDENIHLDEYTISLEDELRDLKNKLQLAYEQLDASNENMQSFNEEMISANEEMQSTNEEMQSVNEELDTLNTDYQLKNKELTEINDDLNNYFRSNLNGQLFVNNDILLMKFSPGTVKQINLLESDIGRPLSNISTNIKFETLIDDIKQVLDQGIVITKEIETNDGKWYQVMTMPYVQEADNKRSGAIITFNNISELKQAQLELDKKNKSLQRVNTDLDNFVHTASHDLLAPLSNIEGSIEVMNLIEVTDPELNKFLGIINSSIKKFRSLIKDIATIGKLEGDMLTMEMVDVNEIINNVLWSLENKISSSGAVINRKLEVKQILFSKKNLRSIMYNLISNGIKFKGDDPPIITIQTIKEGEHVILSVQDNGRGIPKGGIDKIFEMYGRLHQDIEGHGIGLFLVRKIINAANGNITVESEPGKGSKFIIFFKAEPEGDDADKAQMSEVLSTKRLNY